MSQVHPQIIDIALKHITRADETGWYRPRCQWRSISSHEAETLRWGSQALQVMNCLLDVYPSQGGTAAVQHGTATAAILWLAISLPLRLPGTRRNLSRTHTPATCQLVNMPPESNWHVAAAAAAADARVPSSAYSVILYLVYSDSCRCVSLFPV